MNKHTNACSLKIEKVLYMTSLIIMEGYYNKMASLENTFKSEHESIQLFQD